jgi:hypothetical protein
MFTENHPDRTRVQTLNDFSGKMIDFLYSSSLSFDLFCYWCFVFSMLFIPVICVRKLFGGLNCLQSCFVKGEGYGKPFEKSLCRKISNFPAAMERSFRKSKQDFRFLVILSIA